ncbi:MAG: DUF1926 domain-containing protein [Candidatus Omnitrophota bacterium]|nr:DUF1926 domain-containing protein [Candidatus Omnitrophota bacterium]
MNWISARIQEQQRESRKRRLCAWMSPPKAAAPSEQVLLRAKELTLLLDSQQGGRLLELSDRQAQRNLLHSGWVDHLFAPSTTLRDFSNGRARELENLGGLYETQVREGKSSVRAVLTKEGPGLQVMKTAALSSRGRHVIFTHRLANRSRRPMKFLFASEMVFNLKDAHVNRLGEVPGVRRFAVLDPAARLQVSLAFGRPARLWHFPLEAGSGARRVYQGVKLTGVWPVALPARGSWQLEWELKVEEPGGWPRGKK